MNLRVVPILALAVLAPLLQAQQQPAQTAAAAAGSMAADNPVFDVRNGDQQGKLMFKDAELAFESLSDARQSRTWKYSEIREVSKKRKEVRVRPFKGDRYAFQFPNNTERDRIYKLISERVIAARQKR